MNKRKIMQVICAIFIFVLLTGCSENNDYKPEFRTLTNNEVKDFIEEKGINALAVRNLNVETIILFEKSASQGTFFISKDRNGKNDMVLSSSYPVSGASVSISHQAVGNPITFVIFNDDEIFDRATKIIVKYSNGNQREEKISQQKGMIIVDESNENVSLLSLEIYDHNNKILYKQD